MTSQRFRLIYDTEFVPQMQFIERKYHSLIRTTIEQQLIFEPDVETRNRKPLTRETDFAARWELRFGEKNELRVFYSVYVYPEKAEVHILAVGIKIREHLHIGGKVMKL